jgi:6-phosphogluconolactonase (cycloisomerase 2 family)
MGRITHLARLGGLALIFTLGAAISIAAPATASPAPAGHVYVQTNEGNGNRVVAFARASDGTLSREQSIQTGGTGIAPTGLGSQGSVAITPDGDNLLATNAGSDDVSLFEIGADGLHLADIAPVGDVPVSVAVSGRLVYVLNQGADTIQALRITGAHTLVDIPKSTRPLSGSSVAAAQVAFSPDGKVLAVTEKATQTIDTYVVRPNGRAVGPYVQPSVGVTPFGFQFGPDGRLYVSEAPGSAASSYDVAPDGKLSTITASLGNGQGAACWLVVSSDGRFAYTANAATANVSQYAIASNGALSLVGDGDSGSTPPGPVDLDLTNGGKYLYVLSSSSGAITGFSVNAADGTLTSIGGPSGLGIGWAGMVAV